MLGFLPSAAFAQDPEPSSRPPNVLFIVDTSGSMEYKAGTDSFPVCSPTVAGASEKSRWVDVVEVLTGTISDYRCEAVDRHGANFLSEYTLPASSTYPPDADYRNPYHRPLSGDCVLGPGTAAPPLNVFDWLAPSEHRYTDPALACTSPFLQAPDGLIDSLSDVVRFGLMTFDPLPDGGTGYSGTSANYTSGVEGAWSYFVGSAAQGHPVDCMTSQTLEVGVRNAAALPWEGRMIAFGDPDASGTANADRHDRIEKVLLTTRPYGATPIAGALDDAREFFWNDNSDDPLNPTIKFAPNGGGVSNMGAGDPYVKGGCRDQYVILLTDGEPNLDMRTDCEGVSTDPSGRDGECPFDRPEEIAHDLSTASASPAVTTYVVGFAAETTDTGIDCNALTPTDFASSGGACDDLSDKKLQACCTLHRIAYNGGTGTAYFASDKVALREQLSAILAQTAQFTSSATQPVRSPGIGAAEGTNTIAYRILTSYDTSSGGMWRGNIERMRWACELGVPVEQDKDPDAGDDLSLNVNQDPDDRRFATFLPELTGALSYTNRSIRPNLATSVDDGAGVLGSGGARVVGTGSNFVSLVTPAAIQPDTAVGSACESLTAAACRDRVLTWSLGYDNGTGETRCASSAECSVIGDVMHSTPVIVNRPSAVVSDETYEAFMTSQSTRPMMMYTSSNDGVLHGFLLSPNVATDQPATPDENNEVFSFLPPAVLPLLQSQYPDTRQKLLDGVPVVADVVAEAGGANSAYYPYYLQRDAADASGATSTWRTILVQSFGGARGGYFAIDITDPKSTNGPTFLWQLTTDEAGNPLFGQGGATPLITTVFLGGKEVAVAVLPGGYGGAPSAGTCARSGTWGDIPSGYAPRSQVRCYEFDRTNNGPSGDDNTAYVGARSLTIVRLDSGQIIKTFRRHVNDLPHAAASGGPVIVTNLDSPIVGIPAAYPAGPGAVADRIFVGDQDGGLWRVDVSKTNPDDWDMDLFFDGFSRHPDYGSPATAALAGRPIATAPALSIDQRGQITVAFATGDQTLSGNAGEEQYFWSLREVLNGTGAAYVPAVNWYETFEDGQHMLGPIRLVGETLYFSTWTPPAATSTACEGGLSRIWGLHYLKTFAADPTLVAQGGLGMLRIEGEAAKRFDEQDPGVLVFGVSVEYAPSCHDTSTGPDTYLGGSRTSLTNPSASQMQLVFHTGTTNTSKEDLGFKTGFEALSLAPPPNASTVESWAAILE